MSTNSLPELSSLRTMCFPKLVTISKQLYVISGSSKSTIKDVIISTIFEHLIKWCSFALTKDKLRMIRTIILRCSINSSSDTSWCKTVTNRFLFFLNSSNAFCSSSILILGFLPRVFGSLDRPYPISSTIAGKAISLPLYNFFSSNFKSRGRPLPISLGLAWNTLVA